MESIAGQENISFRPFGGSLISWKNKMVVHLGASLHTSLVVLESFEDRRIMNINGESFEPNAFGEYIIRYIQSS